MIPKSTLDSLRREIASLSGQISTGVVPADDPATTERLAELRLRLVIANSLNKAYPGGVTESQRVTVSQVLADALVDTVKAGAA